MFPPLALWPEASLGWRMEVETKPVEQWTAEDILALPAGEFDWLEFKSGELLLADDNWQARLSKYVSAWANYSGGILVVGVSDPAPGKPVEFGVGIPSAKQRKLGERLNSVLPRSVEPPISRFRFHFVPIPGKEEAALVIQISPSEEAPHQATVDQKYYMRRGRNLEPLRHQMIEDIRGRRKHPTVRTKLIFTHGRRKTILAIQIHNEGRILARHVKSVIRFPNKWQGKLIGFDAREGMFDDDDEEGSFSLIEITNHATGPVFPASFARAFRHGYIGGTLISTEPRKRSISHITATTFADEAEPKVEIFEFEQVSKFSANVDFGD
jgi:hypothetical protein